MNKLFRSARSVLMALVSCGVAMPAAAGEVRLSIANGRVTLFAQDATVREILSEWARIGQTRIVNADKITGTPLTLELRDVPEAQALDTILRSASGHVLMPRSAGTTGASVYDRIMILASSRPPVGSPVTPAPFTRTMPQPQPQQQADEDGNDPPQQPAPGVVPGTQMFPGPAGQPGMPNQNQTPMTAPRPGMVPQPQQPVNMNPYQVPNQGQPVVPPNGPGGVAPNQPAPMYPNVPGMTYPNVPGQSPVPGTQPRRPGGGQ